MDAEDGIAARLLAPGAPFELATETVLGERVSVFRQRPPSLRALVERSIDFGKREHLIAGDRRLTYAEHARLVASVAKALREVHGVGKGDRVAILAANCPEWLVSFWATVSLGAIAVAMNAWWAGDELAYALGDAEPRVLLGDEKRLARLAEIPREVRVLCIERDFAALARHDPGAALPDTPLDEDDPAVILYTSGTTGRSKGAVLTHRNLLGLVSVQSFHGARLLALSGAPAGYVPEPPCLLNANPLFHVSGLCAGAVPQLAWGAKSVWTVGRFDPGETLKLIERERVTGWAPHGSMAYKVIHHPEREKYDVSSIRSLGSGGAPVPPEIQAALHRVFPGVTTAMGVGYGLTEATALATLNYGEHLQRHPTSVGRAMPTVELEIRDGDGRALPEGEEGEITLRGTLVMREYWRRPDDTRASIASGRWLRTGDVGRLEDGRLFIASRKRDLILRGAENVYPAEIEARLAEHPAIAEAAVVGVDSAELGQEVKAIVVLRPGKRAQPGDLARWVGDKLAYFKVPAHWAFRDEPLPRNASGKVMKYLLATGEHNPYLED